jgi:hypothetical protein
MLLQKKKLETMSGIADSSGIILESFTVCGEFVGFTINMFTTQEVYCVKFVSIKPEYRRKGLFSMLFSGRINTKKKIHFAISIDTEEEPMIQALLSLGLVPKGKCKFSDDDWFVWKCSDKIPESIWD